MLGLHIRSHEGAMPSWQLRWVTLHTSKSHYAPGEFSPLQGSEALLVQPWARLRPKFIINIIVWCRHDERTTTSMASSLISTGSDVGSGSSFVAVLWPGMSCESWCSEWVVFLAEGEIR